MATLYASSPFKRPRTSSITSEASSSSALSSPPAPQLTPLPSVRTFLNLQHVSTAARRAPSPPEPTTHGSRPTSPADAVPTRKGKERASSEPPISSAVNLVAETPRTAGLVLALENFSLKEPAREVATSNLLWLRSGTSDEASPGDAGLPLSARSSSSSLVTEAGSLDLENVMRERLDDIVRSTTALRLRERTASTPCERPTSLTVQTSLPPTTNSKSSLRSIINPDIFKPRPSPSTSSSSSEANSPVGPSPIPSFPPFTPRSALVDDVAIQRHPVDNITESKIEDGLMTPSNPRYYIVPSSLDKRRRTVTGGLPDPLEVLEFDQDGHVRPIKKMKRANGKPLAAHKRSLSQPKDHLMPTAMEVLEFIRNKGGQCHEGDVFYRFKTGESEHLRNAVNVIIDTFAIVHTGPDRRRWVRLRRDLTFSPVDSP